MHDVLGDGALQAKFIIFAWRLFCEMQFVHVQNGTNIDTHAVKSLSYLHDLKEQNASRAFTDKTTSICVWICLLNGIVWIMFNCYLRNAKSVFPLAQNLFLTFIFSSKFVLISLTALALWSLCTVKICHLIYFYLHLHLVVGSGFLELIPTGIALTKSRQPKG